MPCAFITPITISVIPAITAQLTREDLQAIETLKAEKYDTWEWNFGRSPKYQFANKKRWPGGLLEVHLSVEAGKISGLRIFGDFLSLRPVSELEEKLTGCRFEKQALEQALSRQDRAEEQDVCQMLTQNML
jgi:lipoate-protein ligase A